MRSAWCSQEIGTHAVSLQCAFEYVLSGAQDGGKPYRTTGTCRVEGDPVGRLLRADHQSSGASLRRLSYFSVLLLPALVGSLPVCALRSRGLSRRRSGAADSADLKNPLQKMRVACDGRRSECRLPRFKFYWRQKGDLHKNCQVCGIQFCC